MFLIFASILTGLIVYWTVPDRGTLSKYISVLKLLALVGVAIAVLEITTGTHLPVSKRYGTVSYYKATAWYVNENDFSMFLAMVSFFFFAEALSVDKLRDRMLGTVVFVACLIILLQNGSRAALLAVFAVSILLLGVHLGRNKIRTLASEWTRLPVFTLSTLFGALAIVGLALAISNPFEPQSSRSLWFRWRSLELGVFLLFETVVGSGVGSFSTQWGQIAPPPDIGINLHVGANAHNWFVTLIGEYGFVGTVLFLLAYGWTADGLLEQYLRYQDPASLGLLGALLPFVLAGLGPSNPMVLQIQWIVFGLAIALMFRVPMSDVPDV
jgi:O-antigen ligase